MIPIRVNRSYTVGDIIKEIEHLTPDHPLVSEECPACGKQLGHDNKLCLVYIGAAKEERESSAWFTGGAVAVHDTCIDNN